jgi:hypothetical protein
VVPAVLDEAHICPFKFWFDNQIQDGMSYQNELFYRVLTTEIAARAHLYQYACRLSQSDRFVITANQNRCSLWVSLRNADCVALRFKDNPLPIQLRPPSTAS